LLITFFVLGMLVSFARHEAPAVAVARKAERLGRRSSIERVLRIPVPKAYVPPRRAARRTPAPSRPAAPAAGDPARTRFGPATLTHPLRPTGTDGRGRGR
jgi:cell division protein FtsW